jgi:tripartite-type tricarboxylate transporter receptor subunit TctC
MPGSPPLDALNREEVRSALKRQGTDPVGGTPREFSELIRAGTEKWTVLRRRQLEE